MATIISSGIKNAEALFGPMRDATPEEQKAIQASIDKIYKPTGLNFWDVVDETEKEENK